MFGRAGQQWMVNFRVRDLDAMVQQLRDADLVVDVDPEEYPNGPVRSDHRSRWQTHSTVAAKVTLGLCPPSLGRGTPRAHEVATR